MVNKKKVTIKEIASEAGVSTQTVSRVLNDRPDVAPATRQRIQTIIDRWRYQPSQAARNLIRGKSNAIGVVISGLPHTGPSKLLTGIEAIARKLGYTLSLNLIHETTENNINQSINQMLAAGVDGLLWASVPMATDEEQHLFEQLCHLNIPVVLNGPEPYPLLSNVEVDNFVGGQIATEHLLKKGYKSIGIITGNMNEWSAKQRLSGWRSALQKAGHPASVDKIYHGNWAATSGADGIRWLCQHNPEMDAVFVSNDQMALGVLNTLHQMGKRVPTDMAVVGFDNIPESAFFIPPLTTVRQNMFISAELAVSELDRLIKAQAKNVLLDPKNHVVNPELIIRESS